MLRHKYRQPLQQGEIKLRHDCILPQTEKLSSPRADLPEPTPALAVQRQLRRLADVQQVVFAVLGLQTFRRMKGLDQRLQHPFDGCEVATADETAEQGVVRDP